MRVLTQASGALLLVNAAHAIQTSAAPDLVCVDPRWPEILLERRAAGLSSTPASERWEANIPSSPSPAGAAVRNSRPSGMTLWSRRGRSLPGSMWPFPDAANIRRAWPSIWVWHRRRSTSFALIFHIAVCAAPSESLPRITASSCVIPLGKRLSPALPTSHGISAMWAYPMQDSWLNKGLFWRNIWRCCVGTILSGL